MSFTGLGYDNSYLDQTSPSVRSKIQQIKEQMYADMQRHQMSTWPENYFGNNAIVEAIKETQTKTKNKLLLLV
jgi:hypothetical protein